MGTHHTDRNFDALIFGYYKNGKLPVCRAHTQRIHTFLAPAIVQTVETAGDSEMSFRGPTRGEKRQVGRRPDSGEDEGLSLAEAGPHWAVRIHRNGHSTITCGTPGSLLCVRTRSRRKWCGKDKVIRV